MFFASTRKQICTFKFEEFGSRRSTFPLRICSSCKCSCSFSLRPDCRLGPCGNMTGEEGDGAAPDGHQLSLIVRQGWCSIPYFLLPPPLHRTDMGSALSSGSSVAASATPK
jgi:hypothetical protein